MKCKIVPELECPYEKPICDEPIDKKVTREYVCMHLKRVKMQGKEVRLVVIE